MVLLCIGKIHGCAAAVHGHIGADGETVGHSVVICSEYQRECLELESKFIEIVLTGDTFDAANSAAIKFAKENDKTFIPPFDDEKIIEYKGKRYNVKNVFIRDDQAVELTVGEY